MKHSILFSESRSGRKTVDPRGETTFAHAARKLFFQKSATITLGYGLSGRFQKTALKHIEKRRRSRLLREVYFHEISN